MMRTRAALGSITRDLMASFFCWPVAGQKVGNVHTDRPGRYKQDGKVMSILD
jgi:hypothetical protein